MVSRPTRPTSPRFTASTAINRTLQRACPAGVGPHTIAIICCRSLGFNRIEVEITIAQAGESDRHLRLNTFVHVDSEGSVWNEACFIAVKNSPWDNDGLNGPFCVTAFVMSATFCPSDDSEADSWETQKDRYQEAVQREVNGYFRGPRATLLAILQQAIDYEANRLAEEIGIAQIRFTRPAEGSYGWSVELVAADQPA